ncbi:MAG: hypothetical protein JWQ43_100 [Glaciihabitans sp.]|nr:hypothetical protein [Glaciihabitans sp.]
MGWFRSRGVDVGSFVAPPPVAPAPVARVVADGALIGGSVVRMILRNRVVVDVLRERAFFDRAALSDYAAQELQALAAQEQQSAERISVRRDEQRAAPDYAGLDLPKLQETLRRERIHRELSAAFISWAADADRLAIMVETARDDAWSEIGPVLIAGAEQSVRLSGPGHYGDDGNYDGNGNDREDRLFDLITIDLPQLAEESLRRR